MLTGSQFLSAYKLLRGIVALGPRATPLQLAEKTKLGRLIIAAISDPRSIYIDTNSKMTYLAEVRMHCPELFPKQ